MSSAEKQPQSSPSDISRNKFLRGGLALLGLTVGLNAHTFYSEDPGKQKIDFENFKTIVEGNLGTLHSIESLVREFRAKFPGSASQLEGISTRLKLVRDNMTLLRNELSPQNNIAPLRRKLSLYAQQMNLVLQDYRTFQKNPNVAFSSTTP